MTEAGQEVVLEGAFRLADGPLFSGLRLPLMPGGWTCLLGPSGVGKSTLLRLLAGLETGGTFTGRGEGALADRAAYMAQSDLLCPWLDVTGNVTLGARLRGERPDWDRAERLIARVGLAADRAKTPAALSGGMRQRAALARTLMEDRPFALLDEPFSALDARRRAEMQELSFDMLAGRTVLLVTHDPGEAARLGHRIFVMTAAGLSEHPVPSGDPVRPYDAPEVLEAQASLLAALRQTA